MAFIPTTFLGRFVLISLLVLYLLLLILNLVSFGGLQWVTYLDYNIQFGLWRVCYGPLSAARSCQQWSNNIDIIDTATATVIFSGKPGFIRAAEGLEIVSLIFYVFAGICLIVGILDLKAAPLEYLFGAAAVLLFLCIVFLSASLGVMSKQGRSGHPGAYLDWAWWIGILGLIVTIIFLVLLIGFTLDVAYFSNPNNLNQFSAEQLQQQQQQFANLYPSMSYPYNNQWYPSMSYPYPNQWYPSQYQGNLSPALEILARQKFGYPSEQNFINSYF